MNTRLGIIIALGATAALAGCSAQTGTTGHTAVPTPSTAPVAAPTPTPTPSDDGPASFGESFTYENGLKVKVGAPEDYHPSDSASSTGANHYVVFTVTVTNGTTQSYKPELASGDLQAGDQGAEAVFDSAKGINNPPEVSLQPGRTIKWRDVFAVTDSSKDYTLTVQPGFDYSEAVFTNAQ